MTKPNETAFPTQHTAEGENRTGLTKREYFAAKVMQGFATTNTLISAINNMGADKGSRVIAESAVAMADALIAALNGPPQNPQS